MKQLITTIFLLLIVVLSFAQPCDQRVADSLELTILERSITIGHLPKNADACNTIRVVVHVVYNGAVSNNNYNGYITPEQVQSQIRITNQFFANDSLMLYDGNEPLGYQLELAKLDPDGNATTGIVYHDGYALFGESWSNYGLRNNNNNAIGASTLANAIGWGADMDGKKYLNSYVVSSIDGGVGGGVQAFAYFPTGNAVYGNYNLFNVFGASQLQDEYGQWFNLKSYTNLGLTYTHELLHNFAIYHTFQGNSCAEESDPNWQGDRVADTPPQTQGYGCTGACGFLSNNVMDYLSQGCKTLITEGQSVRANSAIQVSLSQYLVCNDCTADGDINEDGMINISDFSALNAHYGSAVGDANYNPKFDLNCDGVINMLDLSLLHGLYSNSNMVPMQLSSEALPGQIYNVVGQRVYGRLSPGIYIQVINGQKAQRILIHE